MAPLQCCAGGCNATSDTHHMVSVPKDDHLRDLWMFFLVPTNPQLRGLTKDQLVRKKVCQQHFDRYQLDGQGRTTDYSYPCLFSAAEIAYGIPLSSEVYDVLAEHNYHHQQQVTNIVDIAKAGASLIAKSMKKKLSTKKRKIVVQVKKISCEGLAKLPTESLEEAQKVTNFNNITYSNKSPNAACRVCLEDKMNLYSVQDELQDVYQRLTGEKYKKVGYPVHMCYICLTVLRKCHRFMETARDANNVLKQWYKQQNEMRGARPLYTYSISKVELMSTNKLEDVPKADEAQSEYAEYNTNEGIYKTDKDEQTDYSEVLVDSSTYYIEEITSLATNLDNHTNINKNMEYEISPHEDDAPSVIKKYIYNNKRHQATETSGETAVNNETSNDAKIVLTTKEYLCDKDYKIKVKRNKKSHTDRTQFMCNMCGFIFTRKDTLGRHVRTQSCVKPSMRTYTAVKPFICDICGNKYAHRGKLKRHIWSHTGEKPYSCHICAHKTRFKCNLEAHLRTHTGEKPYICDKCGLGCSQKSDLKAHIRTHTGERPYTCVICGFKLKRKIQLVTHMRTHTGERPFTCDFCNHKFGQKTQLVIHMRIHTGEKPYSCNICDHKTKRKDHLRAHMRTHIGGKPTSARRGNPRPATMKAARRRADQLEV